MALSKEGKDATNGKHFTSTFIAHTRIVQPSSHNAIHKRTIEGKTIRPNKAGIFYTTQSLKQVLLADGATPCKQK